MRYTVRVESDPRVPAERLENVLATLPERAWPDQSALDERRLGLQFLHFLRRTALDKVADLPRSLAVATPLPTSPAMSLLGLVKHLTAVERWWFSITLAGLDVPALWDDDDPDADFHVAAEETVASVLEAYLAEAARSDAIVASRSPAAAAIRPGKGWTARWVLAHVTQETARHVGHLDVLRELADGARGE